MMLRAIFNKSDPFWLIFGFLTPIFVLFPRIGIPLQPTLFGPIISLVLISKGVQRLFRKQRTAVDDNRPSVRLSVRSIGYTIGTVSAWLLLGWRSGGWLTIPPNYDAIHHINQISNILRFNSMSMTAIYGNVSMEATASSTQFYPHGTHLFFASIARLFDDPIIGIAASFTFMTVFLLPLGLYVMLRSFNSTHGMNLLGTSIALSAGLIPLGPMSWGGIPTLAGIIILPFSIAWVNLRWSKRISLSEEGASCPLRQCMFRSLLVEVVFATTTAIGLGLIHPTSAVLFVFYILTFIVVRAVRMRIKIISILTILLMFFYPVITFLPGSELIRDIGNVDPFMMDITSLLGQILFMSPFSVWRYWHIPYYLLIFPFVLLFSMMIFGIKRPFGSFKLDKLTATGLCFASGIFVLQISTLANTSERWSFLSWPTALWYRQFARTSYHLPLAICILMTLLVTGLAHSSADVERPAKKKHRFSMVVLSAIVLIPVVGGFRTQFSHREEYLGIGPIDYQTYILARDFLNERSGSGIEASYLIADFTSGVSVLAAGLEIPSSAEPYGREDAAGGIHSVLTAGYNLAEVNGFYQQWGQAITLTNSSAPSPTLSAEVLRDSPYFESIFEVNGLEMWTLKESAVYVDTGLPSRTDLFGGLEVLGTEFNYFDISIESLEAAEIEIWFTLKSPPCGTSTLDVMGEDQLFTATEDWADGSLTVRGTVDAVPGKTVHRFAFQSQPCVIDGDTAPSAGFLTALSFERA